jgi:hypothetical protein
MSVHGWGVLMALRMAEMRAVLKVPQKAPQMADKTGLQKAPQTGMRLGNC